MHEWKKSILVNVFSLVLILFLLVSATTSHVYLPWYAREDTETIGGERTYRVSNIGIQYFWTTNSSSSMDRYLTISFRMPENVTSNDQVFTAPTYGTNASDPNYYGEKSTYDNMPVFLSFAMIMCLISLVSTWFVGTKRLVKEAGVAIGVIAIIGVLLPVLYFMLTFKGGIMNFLYYSDSISGDDYTYTILKHPSWGWMLGILSIATQTIALRALMKQMTDVKYLPAKPLEVKNQKKQELENGMAGLSISFIILIILIVAPHIYLLIPWEYQIQHEEEGERGIGIDTMYQWNADSQLKSVYFDRSRSYIVRDENGTVQEISQDHREVGKKVSYILLTGAFLTLTALLVAYSANNEKLQQIWAVRLAVIAGVVTSLAPLYFVSGYAAVSGMSYMDVVYHEGYMNVSYAWFVSLMMGIINIASGIHMKPKTANLEKQVKKISRRVGIDPGHLIGADAVAQESTFTTNTITAPAQNLDMGISSQAASHEFASSKNISTEQVIPAGFQPLQNSAQPFSSQDISATSTAQNGEKR